MLEVLAQFSPSERGMNTVTFSITFQDEFSTSLVLFNQLVNKLFPTGESKTEGFSSNGKREPLLTMDMAQKFLKTSNAQLIQAGFIVRRHCLH
jgi:hypothetical protein